MSNFVFIEIDCKKFSKFFSMNSAVKNFRKFFTGEFIEKNFENILQSISRFKI